MLNLGKMSETKKGSKKIVIYQDSSGVIFIQPTTRGDNGRHKIKGGIVVYGNTKNSDTELGKKVRDMLGRCD